MTHVNILSLDPGKVTGVVDVVFDTETGDFLEKDVFVLPSVDDTIAYLRAAAAMKRLTVVYEEFTLNPGNQFVADLSGVEIIGALKYAFPHEWLHPRRRSDKVQVPDTLLKDHGLWVTGKDVGWEDGRDANDAMIHLIGYLCFDKQYFSALARFYA